MSDIQASEPQVPPPRLSPNGSGRFRIGRYQMRSDASPLADFMHDPSSPSATPPNAKLGKLAPDSLSSGKEPGDRALGFDTLFLDITDQPAASAVSTHEGVRSMRLLPNRNLTNTHNPEHACIGAG